MKILLIVPEFPPHHIGWWWVVFESLAKTYKKLGHEVLVISGDYTQKNIFKKLKIIDEWVSVLRIPEFFSPISLLNTVLPYPCWYNLSLKKIIKNFSPDFVNVHGYGLFMPAQVVKILKKLQISYTFTIHWAPVSPDKMGNKIISLAYNFYHKFYGFPMLENAKNLTAVSDYARCFEIFKKYHHKIQVIGNGINPEDYKKISSENIFEKYNIAKTANTKIILSLWRIEWIKWFDKIIDLIPQINKKWYKVLYLIAGRDNGQKEELLQKIKKNNIEESVIFLDFIIWEEKNFFLKNVDLIAIPSENETFWISALEARFFKKPVITTFSGWLKDALSWYDFAYSLEDWEKSFEEQIVKDDWIQDFFYEAICKKYLLLK